MKKRNVFLCAAVALIFTACQPGGKQDPYQSCLNIAMVESLSNSNSVEESADNAIKSCESLFEAYQLKLGNGVAFAKGWSRIKPEAYDLFEKDAKKEIKKSLIENYGGTK